MAKPGDQLVDVLAGDGPAERHLLEGGQRRIGLRRAREQGRPPRAAAAATAAGDPLGAAPGRPGRRPAGRRRTPPRRRRGSGGAAACRPGRSSSSPRPATARARARSVSRRGGQRRGPGIARSAARSAGRSRQVLEDGARGGLGRVDHARARRRPGGCRRPRCTGRGCAGRGCAGGSRRSGPAAAPPRRPSPGRRPARVAKSRGVNRRRVTMCRRRSGKVALERGQDAVGVGLLLRLPVDLGVAQVGDRRQHVEGLAARAGASAGSVTVGACRYRLKSRGQRGAVEDLLQQRLVARAEQHGVVGEARVLAVGAEVDDEQRHRPVHALEPAARWRRRRGCPPAGARRCGAGRRWRRPDRSAPSAPPAQAAPAGTRCRRAPLRIGHDALDRRARGGARRPGAGTARPAPPPARRCRRAGKYTPQRRSR